MNCLTCNEPLDVPGKPLTVDCGGDCRQCMVRADDPDELKAVLAEWRVFSDETSGADIKRERFYGFADAGGLAGSFAGYDTREQARDAIQKDHGAEEMGYTPESLGAFSITVLSGEEFVQRLAVVSRPHDFGKFKE